MRHYPARRGFAVVVCLLAGLLTAAPAAAADTPFTIYVATHGDDGNNGLTLADAVATLDGAEQVLAAAAPSTDVEIRIAPGEYVAPTTYWHTLVAGHTISFLPLAYNYSGSLPPDGRPVFRSDGTPGYWLQAGLPTGHPGGDTKLRFYYLDITGYGAGGLAIVGPTATVGGLKRPVGNGMNANTIYGMRFHHMGKKYSTDPVGYGGLIMWNSRNNTIRNNHFENLENPAPDARLIHGIYLSNGASDNLISNNAFRWISGGPMRVRNDANGNLVRDNLFTRTGEPNVGFFSEWSCDRACATTYNQPPECGSHGNVFEYNTLYAGYDGKWQASWSRTPAGADYVGPAGCSNDGEPWLVTRGNVRP
ncbi:right-handed parallel beta-helix repeat-containing protein [Micromonospora sp. DT31]|uniref:right-handed parallel beta-helix repeat-containing protein n=1 Tax=Micromonospora sp. DT31 TaxID=3393434 RepID=UPI003CEC6DD3